LSFRLCLLKALSRVPLFSLIIEPPSVRSPPPLPSGDAGPVRTIAHRRSVRDEEAKKGNNPPLSDTSLPCARARRQKPRAAQKTTSKTTRAPPRPAAQTIARARAQCLLRPPQTAAALMPTRPPLPLLLLHPPSSTSPARPTTSASTAGRDLGAAALPSCTALPSAATRPSPTSLCTLLFSQRPAPPALTASRCWRRSRATRPRW
jgi:hypothetical protein